MRGVISSTTLKTREFREELRIERISGSLKSSISMLTRCGLRRDERNVNPELRSERVRESRVVRRGFSEVDGRDGRRCEDMRGSERSWEVSDVNYHLA
jgi:hypothetical protein